MLSNKVQIKNAVDFVKCLTNLTNTEIIDLLQYLKKELQTIFDEKLDLMLEWNKNDIKLLVIFCSDKNIATENNLIIKINNNTVSINNFDKKGYLVYKKFPHINEIINNLLKIYLSKKVQKIKGNL